MQVLDMFSSIQGEGIYVGYKMLFLRLAGCNLSCSYCDENLVQGESLSPDEVAKKLNELNSSYHHSLALTGGEPLLQVNELMDLLPKLKIPKLLETNSTLPDHLQEIKPLIDIFSLDYKPDYEKEFAATLEQVKDEDTYIKYILLPNQSITELKKAVELIATFSKEVPFIIQPVTPHKEIKHMPNPEEIMNSYNFAKKKLNDVRVIPQTHKFMHIK